MNDKNKVFRTRKGNSTPATAKEYIDKRFGSKRMRRVNEIEQGFAEGLLARVGLHATVLDVPCGSGRFVEVFSKAEKMYAMDISEGMLGEARKKAPAAANCEFLHGSILDLPLDENSVDLVFTMRLFHHVATPEERSAIFSELCRVSRKWVALTFYRKESWPYIRKKIRGKKINGQPIRRGQFYAEAREHGMRLVQSVNVWNNRQTLALFDIGKDTGA